MEAKIVDNRTMCTLEQLEYLKRLNVEGSGQIVEVGPWLGGSTRALSVHGKVFCVDKWVWDESYMGVEPVVGFKNQFLENTKDLDIELDWDDRGCIKLLFLDCIGTNQIAVDVLSRFLPQVRVGGLIVDQDVGWNPVEHFTSLVMYYRLRSKLTILDRVGDMFSFYVREMICESDIRWHKTTIAECLAACQWLMGLCFWGLAQKESKR